MTTNQKTQRAAVKKQRGLLVQSKLYLADAFQQLRHAETQVEQAHKAYLEEIGNLAKLEGVDLSDNTCIWTFDEPKLKFVKQELRTLDGE